MTQPKGGREGRGQRVVPGSWTHWFKECRMKSIWRLLVILMTVLLCTGGVTTTIAGDSEGSNSSTLEKIQSIACDCGVSLALRQHTVLNIALTHESEDSRYCAQLVIAEKWGGVAFGQSAIAHIAMDESLSILQRLNALLLVRDIRHPHVGMIALQVWHDNTSYLVATGVLVDAALAGLVEKSIAVSSLSRMRDFYAKEGDDHIVETIQTHIEKIRESGCAPLR
jgi:hypothetical protein